MTEVLLKAEKLKKVFTAGKKSFAAVDEVSFELKRGQCPPGLGPSGSPQESPRSHRESPPARPAAGHRHTAPERSPEKKPGGRNDTTV